MHEWMDGRTDGWMQFVRNEKEDTAAGVGVRPFPFKALLATVTSKSFEDRERA